LFTKCSALEPIHYPWFYFKIKVGFTRATLSDDFIKTAGWSPLIAHKYPVCKAHCITESAKDLAKPPLTFLARPDIRCNIKR